jgi:NTF2 fold immunity protein
MKIIMCAFLISIISFSFSLYAQSDSAKSRPNWAKLEQELNLSLSGKNKYNVVNSKDAIINKAMTAMTVAEAILIEIYGEANITKQKPYNIYHIKNYWIMDGSLPKGSVGRTFHIIIDDRTSKVIEITHGK